MKTSPRLMVFSMVPDQAEFVDQELREKEGWTRNHLVHNPWKLAEALSEESFDAALFLGDPQDALLALRDIKRRCPGLPVIVIADQWDEDTAADYYRSGAADCISKSRLGRLGDALRRAIDQRNEHGNEAPITTGLRSALAEISALKSVLDQHVIVATTDRAGRITSANAKFCQLSGYTHEELIGKNHRILNSGEHPKTFFRELWASISKGNTWRGEIRNRAKDGSTYWVDTVIIPQPGPDGRPTKYISIRTDITRLKIMEAKLEAARDEAMEMSRLKSEFLANMSHEIRTPMNGIIGMSGLLLDLPLARESKDMASIIQSSAENLLTIINDILDFSRIEAGKMRFNCSNFNLAQMVRESVELLRPSAVENALLLECQVPSNPIGMLQGDPGRVRQVLINLIGNAIKFTDQGAIDVTLSILEESTQRLKFKIVIRDTGCGIAPHDQKRLFQPFIQADGSTTRQHGGTGLGLAISRQIIELMGGLIGLESQLGEGSTFWFELELPRQQGVPSIEDEEPPVTTNTLALANDVPPLCVLLVEDNPANQVVARTLLERMGHAVDLAANGEQALAQLTSHSYDAVLMDCQMPILDGYQATRLIRDGTIEGINPDIRVIALTAHALPQDRVKCLEAGMNDYLTKPIRPKELIDALRRSVKEFH